MATPTANYGLVKAAPTENYDVAVVNANLDTTDAAIKARADSITATNARMTTAENKITALGSLPKPVRAILSNVTVPAGAYVSTARSASIDCAKPCLVQVEYGFNLNAQGTGQADYYSKVWGSGATVFDSDLIANAFTFLRGYGTTEYYLNQALSFPVVLSAGTTTVTIWAYHTGAGTTHALNSGHINITPINWADQYINGGV